MEITNDPGFPTRKWVDSCSYLFNSASTFEFLGWLKQCQNLRLQHQQLESRSVSADLFLWQIQYRLNLKYEKQK